MISVCTFGKLYVGSRIYLKLLSLVITPINALATPKLIASEFIIFRKKEAVVLYIGKACQFCKQIP